MMLYCDNLSTINILKNPMQHSGTKHIDIRYHLIKSLVKDKVIKVKHIPIDGQIVAIFTEDLNASRFETLRYSLRLCVPLPTYVSP